MLPSEFCEILQEKYLQKNFWKLINLWKLPLSNLPESKGVFCKLNEESYLV